MGDDVDEADRFLGFAVAGSGLAAKEEGPRCNLEFRVILQEVIQVKDVKDVQGLALIQVDALDLDVEDRVRPHVRIIAVADVTGQDILAFLLDPRQLFLEGRVIGKRHEVLELRRRPAPAVPDGFVDERGQLGIGFDEPAAMGNAVGLIGEAVREARIELVQRRILEDLRMDFGDTVDAVAAEDGQMGHVDLAIPEDGDVAGPRFIAGIEAADFFEPAVVDFFDDEVDSIRTFEVEDQLSKDLCQEIAIVPELAQIKNDKIPFPSLLAKNSLIVAKDFDYIRQTIGHIYEEGFSSQAVTDRMTGATEMEQQAIKDELKSENTLMPLSSLDEATQHLRIAELSHDANKKSQALLRFNISPQPLFHKNFDLLRQSIESYLIKGYHIYILADSQRQQERLRDIFNGMDESGESVTLQNGEWSQRPIEFTPVEKTIHEGFIDNTLKICCFTDHQIFDRFHKYSLKCDRARSG